MSLPFKPNTIVHWGGSTQIILYLEMLKFAKIIFMKKQIFVIEKSFQGILIHRNGIYNWA
jgi:hypothetical protein